jgi:tetratricopeptide (TPR) repeat protein
VRSWDCKFSIIEITFTGMKYYIVSWIVVFLLACNSNSSSQTVTINPNTSGSTLKNKIEELTKKINSNPTNAVYYNSRGALYLMLGDYKEAAKDLDKSLQLNPKDPVTWDNRGTLKSRLDDFKGASADYQKAVNLDSNNFQYLNNLGWVKMNLEDFASALIFFNKAISINSTNGSVYLNRGLLFAMLGEKQKCCRDLVLSKGLGCEAAGKYIDQFCKSGK